MVFTANHSVSSGCSTELKSLATPNSTLYQCLKGDDIYPILTANGSVIPAADEWLSSVCSAAPCNTSYIQTTGQKVWSACKSDFGKIGIQEKYFTEGLGLYPTVREIACLKTVAPVSESMDNVTVPLDSGAFNTTNGTFCVTDLAEQLSGYLGANLTAKYIESVALGGNSSAFNLLKSIPPAALCTDCVATAYDILEQKVNVSSVSIGSGYTVGKFINGTCSNSSTPFNGTLPDTVFEAAPNTTFSSLNSTSSSGSNSTKPLSSTVTGTKLPATATQSPA